MEGPPKLPLGYTPKLYDLLFNVLRALHDRLLEELDGSRTGSSTIRPSSTLALTTLPRPSRSLKAFGINILPSSSTFSRSSTVPLAGGDISALYKFTTKVLDPAD
jgi:hypothetical protein